MLKQKAETITISGLNYLGRKFIDKVVTYYIVDNILHVNGKEFFSGIKVVISEGKTKFFDNEGEIQIFNNSIEKFIQQIFSDKYYKFKGNKIVKCIACDA